MKTVSVREMKAHWAALEQAVADGETIEVLNRGRPTVRLVPASGRRRVVWDDHLATAIPGKGLSAEEIVRADRDGRY